jgi:hypothetical protein
VPELRDEDQDMELRSWIDPENFNAGYIMRNLHLMPKQGTRTPWQHVQDYETDRHELPLANLDDGTLIYK